MSPAAPAHPNDIGHLLRDLTPRVLAAVARRHGDFDAAEDAVQESLIAAAQQWPANGIPANPRGWLYHVAMRRLTDLAFAISAVVRPPTARSVSAMADDGVNAG